MVAYLGDQAGGVGDGGRRSIAAQLWSAATGVATALRSHRGSDAAIPELLSDPANRHLAVVRLRSTRATRRWLARVTAR